MHLADSNVFDEILLNQSRAAEARAFVAAEAGKTLHLSNFALHSIGVVLRRHKRLQAFAQFLDDLILSGSVKILSLHPSELLLVVDASTQFGLDFDDAYQYVVAEKYDLTIVSFDAHFDRTARGRKTPGQLLVKLDEENV